MLILQNWINNISNTNMQLSLIGITLLVCAVADGGKLVKAPDDEVIRDSYLVHVKPKTPPSQLRKLVNRLHKINTSDCMAKVSCVLNKVAYGFTANLSSKALQQVLESDIVDYVEEDRIVYGGSTRNVTSWGLDRIDSTKAELNHRFNLSCGLSGKGVDVYVLDTGVNYNHKEFSGKVRYAGCDPVDRLFGQTFNGKDCNGHGTHVAGIIAGETTGVSTGVILYSVRVLDCYNRGTTSTIIQGLECVLSKVNNRSHRRAVVNLSLYSSKYNDGSIEKAIWNLMSHGVTVVTISGNIKQRTTDSCKYTPSNIPGVITVAATGIQALSGRIQDVVSPVTAGGACVDLFAPGTNITSASPYCKSCYTVNTGSSMAAPHVTGSVAMLLEKCPSLKPWEVKHILLSDVAIKNAIDFSPFSKQMQELTPNLMLNLNNLCNIHCT